MSLSGFIVFVKAGHRLLLPMAGLEYIIWIIVPSKVKCLHIKA